MLTDLRELKRILEIDPNNTQEDVLLGFLIEQASAWIEELLNRPGLMFKARTEYYAGTGTQKLLLRSRPVFTTPTIQCFVDEAGYYGTRSGSFASTTELTWGDDFTLDIDQDDGTSRSGILIRINNLWPKPHVRQTGLLSPFVGDSFGHIKVIYTAGYTVDSLPATLRLACNILASKLRYFFPLGQELNSDSYEEKGIGIVTSDKEKLLNHVRPLVLSYRNYRW